MICAYCILRVSLFDCFDYAGIQAETEVVVNFKKGNKDPKSQYSNLGADESECNARDKE